MPRYSSGRIGPAYESRRRAGPRGSGIVCVAPERVDDAYRALKAARVICTLREGAIRLSPHAYNTVAEMERVVDVLQEI